MASNAENVSIWWRHHDPKMFKDVRNVSYHISVFRFSEDWFRLSKRTSTAPSVNTLRPRQNGCHFADGMLELIFLNHSCHNLIKISPKSVLKGPINHGSSFMMTSSNRNIFRVTGYLCGKFTGPREIPRTKASDAQLWCFLWSASE